MDMNVLLRSFSVGYDEGSSGDNTRGSLGLVPDYLLHTFAGFTVFVILYFVLTILLSYQKLPGSNLIRVATGP